ncbi:HDOD domain-containing protein [Actinotalea sp. AC32]|nr:HDOD domain-containing protein [Actinotalea sp. AC32]
MNESTTEGAPGAERSVATHARSAAVAPVQGTVHRRPVVTLDGHVVGYWVTVNLDAGVVPTQRATDPGTRHTPDEQAARLHEAYLALDLPNLVADRFVFLPATPAMLDGFVPTPVLPGRVVLVLPTGFEHRPDAVERAAALRGLGMQLAIDDYRGEPAQELLVPQVGFVTVRVGAGPVAPLVHHVHRGRVRVLATDVRDRADEDQCRASGVDAIVGTQAERDLQVTVPGAAGLAPGAPGSARAAGAAGAAGGSVGSTAAGPVTVPAARPAADDDASAEQRAAAASRVLRAGQAQCLAVMHLLHDPDMQFGHVSQVIDTDPVLTLRVLHLVNSGAFGLGHEIDTVAQATVLLGARELTTLVTALLLDARPDAMDSLWLILARALTCETLAGDSTAYTVGMLSALAEQLGIPVSVIVEKVGVSQTVAAAMRHETGPFGPVLAAVRAHERADALTVVTTGFVPEEVSAVYMQAVADALATARAVTREPSGF